MTGDSTNCTEQLLMSNGLCDLENNLNKISWCMLKSDLSVYNLLMWFISQVLN
jgi:hypothetical protein